MVGDNKALGENRHVALESVFVMALKLSPHRLGIFVTIGAGKHEAQLSGVKPRPFLQTTRPALTWLYS